MCTCPPGFTNTRCQDQIDVCVSAPCLNGVTCVGSLNNYACYCAAGYTGLNCQTIINPCVNNPCLNNGLCIQTTNPLVYQCQCLPSKLNNYFNLHNYCIINEKAILDFRYTNSSE